ncbi:MAG: alpha/beta hydrolase [Caldilineaceae bacterium]|nr:alpha/beta hydrolase [Caldilineaceae bacterium]
MPTHHSIHVRQRKPRPSIRATVEGSGPTVLLVHGWAGRGSQLAPLVAPLVNAGYRVVAFDAPAHGDSPGDRTNLLEVSNLIRTLSQEYAGFAAIVGHSFGGMAAGHALYEGARADKLVTIGSPVTMASVLDGFGSQLNASPRTVAGVKRAIERLAKRDVDTFSLSHTLAGSPVTGLIVHDEEDKEVGCDQARLLHRVWPQSSLYITQGLGHRRILRDAATIARIVAFIVADTERTDQKSALDSQDSQLYNKLLTP